MLQKVTTILINFRIQENKYILKLNIKHQFFKLKYLYAKFLKKIAKITLKIFAYYYDSVYDSMIDNMIENNNCVFLEIRSEWLPLSAPRSVLCVPSAAWTCPFSSTQHSPSCFYKQKCQFLVIEFHWQIVYDKYIL